MALSKRTKYFYSAVFLSLNLLINSGLCRDTGGNPRSDTDTGNNNVTRAVSRDRGVKYSGVLSRGDTTADNKPALNRFDDGDDRNRKRTQISGSHSFGWQTSIGNSGHNCSCSEEVKILRRDFSAEVEERKTLGKAIDTYVAEFKDFREGYHDNKTGLISARRTAAFSAKLSFNHELKPLDTVAFDTILSNQGGAYDAETGVFTAPVAGVYMFHCTILSGYNTKIETAIIVNGKEVARMYSGAHDAHGSGSNMAIVILDPGDRVQVRLLYQGGNHVHGYYSTFSGALLAAEDKG